MLGKVAVKRIARELENFKRDHDALENGLTIEDTAHNIWLVRFNGPPDSIYEDESHTLQVTFSERYPMEPPEVVFLDQSPVHEHVYSNGHICLNILYDDWSPAMTIQTVCISIVSMLASAKKKSRPPDDLTYSMVPRNPKKTRFHFHDDNV